MKKIISLVVAAVIITALTPSSAKAHVLIPDTSGNQGAILHITPDDNPIAGEEAALYLDTQYPQKSTELTIQGDAGSETIIATVDGSLASFRYTFPKQGVYSLTFKATFDTTTATFTYSQRVSRGIAGDTIRQQPHTWAELLLIAGCIGLAVLAITAFNRRTDISKQSTF